VSHQEATAYGEVALATTFFNNLDKTICVGTR